MNSSSPRVPSPQAIKKSPRRRPEGVSFKPAKTASIFVLRNCQARQLRHGHLNGRNFGGLLAKPVGRPIFVLRNCQARQLRHGHLNRRKFRGLLAKPVGRPSYRLNLRTPQWRVKVTNFVVLSIIISRLQFYYRCHACCSTCTGISTCKS